MPTDQNNGSVQHNGATLVQGNKLRRHDFPYVVVQGLSHCPFWVLSKQPETGQEHKKDKKNRPFSTKPVLKLRK